MSTHERDATSFGPDAIVEGTLHIHVAFDWGDGIDLARAGELAPGGLHPLARRPRTPASIAYQTTPRRFGLGSGRMTLAELGEVEVPGDATVFDFGAVSVALHVPLRSAAGTLLRLAGSLSDARGVTDCALQLVKPLFDRLLPAIDQPEWSELTEEYFVFQLPPKDATPPPEALLTRHAAWIAGLVRLEDGPLSAAEVAEAVRASISYSPADLFVADWSAAVLMDSDCEETLQAIELANLQLLEFRHIDGRLDSRIAAAHRLVQPSAGSLGYFWRRFSRPLRALGELRIEARDMVERTDNVLKLVGDQYLARVYRILAQRFHLAEWEQSIERSLQLVEGIYQVFSDQAASFRAEFLEWIIIALIAFEIAMSLFGR